MHVTSTSLTMRSRAGNAALPASTRVSKGVRAVRRYQPVSETEASLEKYGCLRCEAGKARQCDYDGRPHGLRIRHRRCTRCPPVILEVST
jgi:hypothetical protein